MRRICFLAAICLTVASTAPAEPTLPERQKQTLIRDLTAEMGSAKVILPRSKKALDIQPGGAIDLEEWGSALNEYGPAARVGDLVQITKVEFKGNRLVLEINYGIKGGAKWWHRVQMSGGGGGMGGGQRGTTLGQNSATHAPGGTTIALIFEDGIPDKDAKEFQRLIKPILDFEQRSATELYMETIEPRFKQAIEKGEIVEGMDRDMVLVVKDRPDRKVREARDGVDTEDWIYGTPPGEVVFVTFVDGRVIRVKHEHANLGGEVRKIEPIAR